jgi:hypothetical protein
MLPTSSVRQLLAGRALHIAALAVAGLLAPVGACVGEGGGDGAGGNGAGGGGAGGYGAGGAQQCSLTHEQAVMHVGLPNGGWYSCSGAPGPPVILEGVVRNMAADTIVVDTCHPNANCAPLEHVITLSGTDLSVSIPDGTFVQVGIYFPPSEIWKWCILHVIVRNLPVWGGTPNPTSDRAFLWLAYHDGFDAPYAVSDDPYQTERELACDGESLEFPNLYISVYTWRFSFPDAPGAEVVAPEGQTVTWSVPEGEHAGEYRVRNVKAVRATHHEDIFWIARK